MDAFWSLHLNHEEFVCLKLLVLPCIMSLLFEGFLGVQGHHPLRFTMYPAIIGQGIIMPNLGYSPLSFTVCPIPGFLGVNGKSVYSERP